MFSLKYFSIERMALSNSSLEKYISLVHNHADNQLRSFNYFLDKGAHTAISGRTITTTSNDEIVFDGFRIEDLSEQKIETASMTPFKARSSQMTYACKWYMKSTINYSNGTSEKVETYIGSVPLPVGCNRCFTRNMTDFQKLVVGESPNDFGGYFIVRGMEMIPVGVDKVLPNKFISIPEKRKSEVDSKIKNAASTSCTLTTDRGTDRNDVFFDNNILKFSLPSIESDDKNSKYSINVIRLFFLLGMTKVSEIYEAIMEFIDDKYRSEVITKLIPSVNQVVTTPDHIGFVSEFYTFSSMKSEDRRSKKRNKATEITISDIRNVLSKVEEIHKSSAYLHTSHLLPALMEKFGGVEEIAKSISILESKEFDKIDDPSALRAAELLSRFRIIFELEQTLKADLFPFIETRFGIDLVKDDKDLEKDAAFLRKLKIKMLCILISKHIMVSLGYSEPDNRDSWSNKRILLIGEHFIKKIRGSVGIAFGQLVQANMGGNPKEIIGTLAKHMKFDNIVNKIFFPQSKGGDDDDASIIRYTNGSNIATLADLLNTVASLVSSRSKNPKKRDILPDALGFLDWVRIQENESAGLIKYLAITALVARGSSITNVTSLIYASKYFNDFDRKDKGPKSAKIIISGAFFGWTNEKYKLRDELIAYKRRGNIDSEASVVLEDDTITVLSTGGYLIRPLLVVNIETQELKVKEDNPSLFEGVLNGTLQFEFNEWLDNGWIQYVSPWEMDKTCVAKDYSVIEEYKRYLNEPDRQRITAEDFIDSQLDPGTKYFLIDESPISVTGMKEEMRRRLENNEEQIKVCYTYCEMWKASILGWAASLSPHPPMNQGPRNAYQSGMSGQTLTNSFINNTVRYHDMFKGSFTSTRTLVNTACYRALDMGQQGTAQLLFTAFKPANGNEEDGCRLNEDTVRRGFMGNRVITQIKAKVNKAEAMVIGALPSSIKRMNKDYTAINDSSKGLSGFPIIGSYVNEGSCVLAVTKVIEGETIDCSTYLKFGEKGRIISYSEDIDEKGKGDKTIITIILEAYDSVRLGDKFSSENSQKCTNCQFTRGMDMLYTDSGMVVDLETTAHSIPTRMTPSSFWFMLENTLAAIFGIEIDATAFEGISSYEELQSSMNGTVLARDLIGGRELIFNGACYYKMRSGLTGEYLQEEIFAALMAWQPLKHIVLSKYQTRGILGSKDNKTGQPVKGRSLGGGLKVGTMKLAASLSAGAITYITNCYRGSNPVTIICCQDCGRIARSSKNNYSKDYRDNFVCLRCHTVKTPKEEKKFLSIDTTRTFTNAMEFLKPTDIELYPKVEPIISESRFLG